MSTLHLPARPAARQPDPEPPPPEPSQHAPADAETIAWNEAREAEWEAAQAAERQAAKPPNVQRSEKLEMLFRELAPAAFKDDPTPPLAIGIDRAVFALVEGRASRKTVRGFLSFWTRRPEYLQALARGDIRLDINGNPVEPPSAEQREHAIKLLGGERAFMPKAQAVPTIPASGPDSNSTRARALFRK